MAKLDTSLRVLLTDDDASNRQIVLAMLQRLGYSADEAASGEEAIRRFERADYDLILMDCQMPGLDGLEAARRIRAKERAAGRRQSWIVALTGQATEEDRELFQEAGMDGVLEKPVSLAKLREFFSREKVSAERAPSLSREAHLPRVDYGQLRQLQALNSPGKPDLAMELIEYFLGSTPQLLEKIRGLFERGEIQAMEKLAHKLKSTCHNVGAKRLARLCEELELGTGGDPRERVCRLPLEYAEVARELRRFSASPPDPGGPRG